VGRVFLLLKFHPQPIKEKIMKKISTVAILSFGALYSGFSIAQTGTFYCPPEQAIKFTHEARPSSFSLYSNAAAVVISKNGNALIPALTGEGPSIQAVQFKSAAWTGQKLWCNYAGININSEASNLIMSSPALGTWRSCHFPEGSKCLADSSYSCPMECSRNDL
jgi:hypothetical protein